MVFWFLQRQGWLCQQGVTWLQEKTRHWPELLLPQCPLLDQVPPCSQPAQTLALRQGLELENSILKDPSSEGKPVICLECRCGEGPTLGLWRLWCLAERFHEGHWSHSGAWGSGIPGSPFVTSEVATSSGKSLTVNPVTSRTLWTRSFNVNLSPV